ncbi:MAG: hypothetical protein IJ055_03830 [Oscillospiraceae bacterium]|nr:hypothetical protein [Oscillospiraceae bacterium]
MKPGRVIAHVLLDLAVVAAALVIPVLLSPQGRTKLSGTDANSSASVVIDAPSGDFLVFLNLDVLEEDAFWQTFFSGGEVDYCFEDISCMVADSDTAALEMAQSYQSRLSEHQMALRQEDMTLMLSRADCGKFQVIVISGELAEHYRAQSVYEDREDVASIRTTQEETS